MSKVVFSMTFYAVAIGKNPGVYTDWEYVKEQVRGFPGATYKKFESELDAWKFVATSCISKKEAIKEDAEAVDAVEVVEAKEVKKKLIKKKVEVVTIDVFTDGSCLGNQMKHGKRAGYAVVFPEYPQYNEGMQLQGDTMTNNRAEMTAIIRAFEICNMIDTTGRAKVAIYTDSKITMQMMTDWIPKWKAAGWKKADGKPIANFDLVKKLAAFLNADETRPFEFEHVDAHTGKKDWKSTWNARADNLAKAAAEGHAISSPSTLNLT